MRPWRSWAFGLLRSPTIRAYSGDSQISDADFAKAREWYRTFSKDPGEAIPRTIGEVSYARSSGPGGQNVNKVNSKAQLRVPVGQLLSMLPSALHSSIRTSRYYTEKTDSLLIEADDSRKQATNKDACYDKLAGLVDDVFKSNVPGETSQEQKEKVRNLKKAENASRLKSKKIHSSKKAGRSKSFD